MEQFTIRQVEQLCGVKAHTIRIWEKRYNLVIPERSDGKQRLYSNEDIRSILRVVYLYNKGIKISKIARMKESEISDLVNADDVDLAIAPMVLARLMEASIELDDQKLEEIFEELEVNLGFEEMILTVVYPFLEMIGRAWMTAKISPNNEHFVSHIVSKRIILATSQLNRLKKNGAPVILLFQPEGELHEIPLLFINYLLIKNRCSTVYFGSNIGVDEIEYYCRYKPVSIIHFHVITNTVIDDPQEYLDMMAKKFDEKTVVMSGPVTKNLETNFPNVRLFKSQQALNEFVNKCSEQYEQIGV